MSFDLLIALTVEAVRSPGAGWEVRVTDGAGTYGTARHDDLSQALADLAPVVEAAFLTEVFRNEEPVFIDGDPTGCCCDVSCEMPCWQRVGLTSEPCCERCAPLPNMDEEVDGGS